MLDSIKKIAVNMLTGACAMTSLLLVAVGFSDHVDPVDYPSLACLGMTFPFFVVANLVMLIVMLLFKWKRAWVPLLGFAFAYVPIRTYLPIHARAELPDSCIKVMSYNVCGYGGNYKYEKGVDTVAAYIRRIDPDIVCLQEEQFFGSGSNPVEVMKTIYAYNDTTLLTPPDVEYANILGIHTRYPILKKERLAYTSECNGSVAYFLQVGQDTLIVINNHLESTHLSTDDRDHYKQVINGDMERQAAGEEALHILDQLGVGMLKRAVAANVVHQYIVDHSDYPLIVCGDFNDTPISYSRRLISQSLTDCFVESGCGLGLSFNQIGFTFRIDHMMCSSHFRPYNCTVDSEMDASDHNPLFCWLKRQ
ncbi:MAG: endonuclease/exonuclease/phosphatase family protein [Prevotella sp.]|nr:endonuclease/exonuclease/phosphatase family protein [Prevotella sp.]